MLERTYCRVCRVCGDPRSRGVPAAEFSQRTGEVARKSCWDNRGGGVGGRRNSKRVHDVWWAGREDACHCILSARTVLNKLVLVWCWSLTLNLVWGMAELVMSGRCCEEKGAEHCRVDGQSSHRGCRLGCTDLPLRFGPAIFGVREIAKRRARGGGGEKGDLSYLHAILNIVDI